MKKLFSILVIAATLSLILVLNSRLGQVPPLGKFLDPFHGFWQNNTESISLDDHSTGLAGLSADVQVLFDKQGIPHIFAQNMEDLVMAQGFVHGCDRLWQMEFQTHIAAGRLSEIIGSKGLEIDRYLRRFGLKYGAERSLRLMERDPELLGILNAYTKGVNAFINQLEYADYPVEYKLLDYKPEPWNNLKTALVVKLMTFDLTGKDTDIELTNAFNLFGSDLFTELYPEGKDNIDPIIPPGTPWPEPEIDLDTPAYTIPGMPINKGFEENPNADNGSNNWAIAGSKSKTGSPILCNDPHLSLNLPSLWYQVQLSCPGYNVRGVSLPGAMGIVLGFNDSIAWGMTNAQRDVKDWYKMEFTDDKKSAYHFGDSIIQTKQSVEEIKVRGAATFFDTITYTHHGPVIFERDHQGDTSRVDMAMKWIGHDATQEIKGLLLLNQAKNYGDYKEAIEYISAPSQNLVFASVSGDIAIWQFGTLPVKWPGQGRFLLDGSNPQHAWHGYIPTDHAPQIKNPVRGFVSSANQYPTDSLYPYYYNGNFINYRNQQINSVLSNSDQFGIEDMMELQTDNYNLRTAETLPFILALLQKEKLTDEYGGYLNDLQQWDYQYSATLTEPAIFEAIYDTLITLVYDEVLKADQPVTMPDEWMLPYLLKNNPGHIIFDMAGTDETETAQDIVTLAFLRGIDRIRKWQAENKQPLTWANYHNVTLSHLTRTIEPFSIDQIQTNGSRESVNAVQSGHGPSWRLVASLENPIKAWGLYPGGQSGNPGSIYYSNLLDYWAEGKYYELLFFHSADEDHEGIIARLKLSPK